MQVNNYEIEVSHPDKRIFPQINVTKEELIDYYEKIADIMLPHMKNRTITMHRYPDGVNESGFYMQHKPDYFPDWVKSIEVKKKDGDKTARVVCNNKASLVYIANQGCITPHIWLSQIDQINQPDKMIFDLDPSDDDLSKVKKAAFTLKEVLENKELSPFVMTTGINGLHVVVPLVSELSFDEVKEVADEIANEVIKQSPKEFTMEQRKDKRGNRVFIDTLRNAYGQTSVAPYALRPTKDATVATPLTWDELNSFDPKRYHIKNIFKRLGQIEDPWKEFKKSAQRIDGM